MIVKHAVFSLGLILAIFTGYIGPAFAVDVSVKVLVKIKDGAGPDKAFVHLGGFKVKRNQQPFTGMKCPDVSNDKGEFTCKLVCEKKDNDLLLTLMPPTKDDDPNVGGLVPPASSDVNVKKCKIQNIVPVLVLYRTQEVSLTEFAVTSTLLKQLLADPNGVTINEKDGSISLNLKSFKLASPILEAAAANREQRIELLELAERFQALQAESPLWHKWRMAPYSYQAEELLNTNLDGKSPTLGQYSIAARSAVLKATVTGALGAQGGSLIKVSPSSVDFMTSILSVKKTINNMPFQPIPAQDLKIMLDKVKTTSDVDSNWATAPLDPKLKM